MSGRRESDEDIGGADSIEYDLFAIDNRQENDDDQQLYFCDIDAEMSFLSASNASSTAFSATESIRVSETNCQRYEASADGITRLRA